jgi:hypothetical protein
MMRISNHKEIGKIKQELRPWLDKWRISPQTFDGLPVFQKILLHSVVYTGTITPSDAQLRALYQDLGLGERRTGKGGGFGPAAVESVAHEDLKEIFRLLRPSEMLPDLYKY